MSISLSLLAAGFASAACLLSFGLAAVSRQRKLMAAHARSDRRRRSALR
ncbi:MAG: hypothetical protein RLZZ618_2720 [Pseudomonadota bacterium]|jgi:hypothetical protein